MESDTHADTFVLGGGTLELADYMSPVNVQGYDPTLGVKQYRIISGAIAYTHPYSGQRYHLVVHQAVHIPDLPHHLLYPMQCRAHGVTVNDCPRIYVDAPDELSHSIVARDENSQEVILPFTLRGVTSLLNVEPLTRDEWELNEYPRITLTDEDLTWDPHTNIYADQENDMVDRHGVPIQREPPARGLLMVTNSVCATTTQCGAADITSHSNFGNVLRSNVQYTNISYNISRVSNAPAEPAAALGDLYSIHKKQVDAPALAKPWNIDLVKAKKTVRMTTQRGVRTTLHPSLSKRYPTNDRMKRCRHMPHPVFSDTLNAGVKSK